jgi:hypothetical protein
LGIIIRKNKVIQEDIKIRRDVKNIDLVRGTLPEQEAADVGVYEYSGYHRNTIDAYLRGYAGSPYSRQYDKTTGELRSCGMNFYDRLVQQEEMLLQATGEPVMLMRRKWTGELCPCYDKPRQRSHSRCPVCFGTGYVGGYVTFINPRDVNGKILVRFPPNEEDLEAQEHGLWQKNVPTGCWTLPVPIVRDRDIIVRFDPTTGQESWRYEILNVTRNSALFNMFTAQVFTISRLDKTHPVYFVRPIDLVNNLVGDLRGKGDELQDAIEAEKGDGYNDGGFSLGYFSGYDMGYHDAFYQREYRSIPDDNRDGYVDIPFGPSDDASGPLVEFWLVGYREGYKDGWEDGDKHRLDVQPPDRPDWEKRRTDIPSNSLEHPDPRGPDPGLDQQDPRAGYYSGIGVTGPSVLGPAPGSGLNRGDCAGK